MDGMVHWTVQTWPVVTKVGYPPGGPAIATSAGLSSYETLHILIIPADKEQTQFLPLLHLCMCHNKS